MVSKDGGGNGSAARSTLNRSSRKVMEGGNLERARTPPSGRALEYKMAAERKDVITLGRKIGRHLGGGSHGSIQRAPMTTEGGRQYP
ncbi:hypothetical protein FKM82_026152 [Ascaphus truei]